MQRDIARGEELTVDYGVNYWRYRGQPHSHSHSDPEASGERAGSGHACTRSVKRRRGRGSVVADVDYSTAADLGDQSSSESSYSSGAESDFM